MQSVKVLRTVVYKASSTYNQVFTIFFFVGLKIDIIHQNYHNTNLKFSTPSFNRLILICENSAGNNRSQYEALGKKPHTLCCYFLEPCAEVYRSRVFLLFRIQQKDAAYLGNQHFLHMH